MGMRVTTPMAVEIGHSIAAVLSYHDEVVEIQGTVRWRREVSSPPDGDDRLASWEVGIAFTAVGEASENGIWRTLAVHRRSSVQR